MLYYGNSKPLNNYIYYGMINNIDKHKLDFL